MLFFVVLFFSSYYTFHLRKNIKNAWNRKWRISAMCRVWQISVKAVDWNALPEALHLLLWNGAACRDELPNIGLLLTLSNFLAAAFFLFSGWGSWWESSYALPLPSCSRNAVWICCNTRAFYRNNNHVRMTSRKSVLNLGTLCAFAVFETCCSEMMYQLIFL